VGRDVPDFVGSRGQRWTEASFEFGREERKTGTTGNKMERRGEPGKRQGDVDEWRGRGRRIVMCSPYGCGTPNLRLHSQPNSMASTHFPFRYKVGGFVGPSAWLVTSQC